MITKQFSALGYDVRMIGSLEDEIIVWTHGFSESVDGCIVADVSGTDWNRDFSPWPAEALDRRSEAFSGGADDYLKILTETLMPQGEQLWPNVKKRIIAGYSLAGLFALYAATRVDVFDGVACGSGSMWYPNWTSYLGEHPIRIKAAAFSLGDREPMGKNRAFAAVGTCTENVVECLRRQGVSVEFRWESGGHFTDPQGRRKRCIIAAMKGVSL
ncbi:MAG: esterase [Clostridia bacterium]|nr:esterase [Clostridia bacterium]